MQFMIVACQKQKAEERLCFYRPAKPVSAEVGVDGWVNKLCDYLRVNTGFLCLFNLNQVVFVPKHDGCRSEINW